MNFPPQDQSKPHKYPEHNQAPLEDQQWQWSYCATSQQYSQGLYCTCRPRQQNFVRTLVPCGLLTEELTTEDFDKVLTLRLK